MWRQDIKTGEKRSDVLWRCSKCKETFTCNLSCFPFISEELRERILKLEEPKMKTCFCPECYIKTIRLKPTGNKRTHCNILLEYLKGR